MDRYPYSPRLIRYCSGYSLSDPPCRVGAELVSLAIVKFLNSTYQSQISLLDKIEENNGVVIGAVLNAVEEKDLETQEGLRSLNFSTDQLMATPGRV